MADTTNWNPMGEVYYRNVEIYDMLWIDKVDLGKFKVAAGTFGGPIAITKDDVSSGSQTIYIFTASGKQIANFSWDCGRLVQMGFSVNEDLICISEDGKAYVYGLFGNFKRQFSLGMEVQKSRIFECSIFASTFGTGIGIMTCDYQFYIVNNVDDVKVKRLQIPYAIEAPPSSWMVLSLPDEHGSKVLMAIDNNIFELDAFQAKQKSLPTSHEVSSYTEMAISFNQKYVAILADTGLVWIGSSNLQDVYCEYNTNLKMRPKQLVWCGSGAVVGYWDSYLLMIGPTKETVRYFLDSNSFLVQEVDGLRIIGNEKHQFLQKVPVEVEDVFKLGSVKPGAMLYDANVEYENMRVRVDDYMRAIKNHLQEAVHECIKAAGHEFEPKAQRSLMKAASFGKSFLKDMKPQTFVEMCQTLRVLNNVRDYKVGIPLTFEELQRLTLPVLIDRLVLRRHYLLAIKICDYLRIPKREGASRILAHWACHKVQQTDIDDEQLAKEIAAKLGDTPGISYIEIASNALDQGRTALAIKLLDYEPKAANQVPLLLRMKKYDLALQKAVDSSDTDQVYMVMEHLKEVLGDGEFRMKIRSYPLALSLYIKKCKQGKQRDRRTLVNIYYEGDQFKDSGNAYVQDSYAEKALDARIQALGRAKESFDSRGLQPFTFGVQATTDQIKLLQLQQRLEDQFGKKFLDLSMYDTLFQLIYHGYHKNAESMRKDFSIPDTRFWWKKIQALGAARDWVELEKFSKSKKSPIGYEPFVEVCMKYGPNRQEAEKYIQKVPIDKRTKLYMKMGYYEQAAEMAFQVKNIDDLNAILPKCAGNRQLTERIQMFKSQLSYKR
eukprot:Seg4875.2 transcript_id=Seg4875.2/GoldUCD/mRNA.D3Y31 product="Vacuolar protein sorting-associated protein 16" protein_id=Seg4875.2/GoldUCD/D3Y31